MSEKPRKAPEIGGRLQALRKARGLSLDDLAATSRVSRSMLSQVERGLANPTFATLWALTQALGIDISQLIGDATDQAPAIEVIEEHNIPRIRSADGHCTLRILSPPETTGASEWYLLDIDAGAALTSQPHTAGSREHLSILSGEASVTSGDSQASGKTGDTLRYRADVAHSIRNTGTETLKALLVVMSGA